MKAVIAAFNQEKALVGAFSVITPIGWNFLKHYSSQASSMASSASSSASISIPSSAASSRRGSLSSSRPEFRPVHTEIIKRNLVKEFLTSCSFKEKKTTSQCIMRKLEPTLSMVDIGWFSEQEDELDREISDLIGQKTRRNRQKKAAGNESEMLFNIDF